MSEKDHRVAPRPRNLKGAFPELVGGRCGILQKARNQSRGSEEFTKMQRMRSERPADSRLAIVAATVTFALGLCLTGPAASAVVESAFPLSDDRVATPLPIRFVGVSAGDIRRWMPRLSRHALPAMPWMTVQKMIGAISTRIALMKAFAERRHPQAGIGVEAAKRDAGGHRQKHQEPQL